MALEEVPFVVVAIVGALSGVVFIFLYNFACAPYRIERDAHELTKSRLRQIEADLPNYGTYEGDHEQLMLFVVNRIFPLIGGVRSMAEQIPDAPKIEDNQPLMEAIKSLAPLSSSPVEYIPLPKMIDAVNTIEANYALYVREIDRAMSNAKTNVYSLKDWEHWRSAHNAVEGEFEVIRKNSRLGALFRPTRKSRWGRLVGTANLTENCQLLQPEGTG
ncbi:hypothetical protein CLV41_10579 [Roseibium marinum]|uniref:Uncharacterized protein n=2 Tax=Roseibium marinum TaxID=281252 RepID=A0A2S3UT59_9HYPH|nr:hypothetical protein CLV41_10579 [Roseibium marinum]